MSVEEQLHKFVSFLGTVSRKKTAVFLDFVQTRSYAALRAADLDWIVGPGYSLGRVHSGINKNVTDTKRDRRGVTTDLGGGQGRNKQKRYRHKT